MFIKPFTPIVKNKKGSDTMTYLGIVEDNNDPEKLGRVKVRIEPYSDLLTKALPWACPLLGSSGNSPSNGGLNIPEIGSQVRVTFPSQDLTAPYYGGAELNEINRTTFFDDDYPNTYGYRDSIGNFTKVNKQKGTIHLQHASSSNLKVAADGSMQITLSNGAYFTLSNYNNFEINVGAASVSGTADGHVEIASNVGVNIKTGTLNVNAPVTTFSGSISADSGAKGTFATADGRMVTVAGGLIVSIK